MELHDNDHAAHLVQIRTYAITRDLDPNVPQEFEQAHTELRGMSIRELGAYTDRLRCEASITNNGELANDAALIDNPELGVDAEDEIKQGTEPEASFDRARSALSREQRAEWDGVDRAHERPATGWDLSL